MTVTGEEVSCNVGICFCVACWTQISMGCMRSTALFQKVHHPWPTSKSETISHDKTSLGQGEVSSPNWAGRFLPQWWLSRAEPVEASRPALEPMGLVIVDISGGYSAMRSAIQHRLVRGSYPDSCTLKASPCCQKWAGPREITRKIVLWDAVHTSSKVVTEWLSDGSSSHIFLFLRDLWCLYRFSVHKCFPQW